MCYHYTLTGTFFYLFFIVFYFFSFRMKVVQGNFDDIAYLYWIW